MEMGKNGGRDHAGQNIVERAALLGGAVDVEDGARVPQGREERQAEDVVVVQVGEQHRACIGMPAARSGGCR